MAEYDSRLSGYLLAYAPVLWIRLRSAAVDSAFNAYEAAFRPRPSSGWRFDAPGRDTILITRSFYLPPEAHLPLDSRDFLASQGVTLPTGGYAYALPMSHRMVARATEAEHDLITTIISSCGNDTPRSFAAEANLD